MFIFFSKLFKLDTKSIDKFSSSQISGTYILEKEDSMDKKTPLYDVHVEEGGKIVSFAGYLMPVQYEGLISEHNTCRTKCGIFDVSHMGQIIFRGAGALATLNHLLTNDYTNMEIGRVRYGIMCYENGGAVDDLVVYKFGDETYLVVVNAANKDKDFKWMSEHLKSDTTIEDISESVAQVALQGPNAPAILSKLTDESKLPTKYYTAVAHVDVDGIDCMVSTTGYTGEGGYEIYTAAENGAKLWRALREAGQEYGLVPCGLGARDTLRLEASMPLYGHELTSEISPLEAGLNFGIKLDHDFIGRDALKAMGDPARVRVGFEVVGKGIIREEQDVYIGNEKVGFTTSGTKCPFIDKAVAMGYVERDRSEVGTEVEVDVRGRRVAAKIVPMPFYSRKK